MGWGGAAEPVGVDAAALLSTEPALPGRRVAAASLVRIIITQVVEARVHANSFLLSSMALVAVCCPEGSACRLFWAHGAHGDDQGERSYV